VERARQLAAARRQAQVDADPIPARRARLRAKPTAADYGAKVGEPITVGGALALMKEQDGSRDKELDAAAATREEMTSGRLTYHPIRPKE
jgi:hypothetical protein